MVQVAQSVHREKKERPLRVVQVDSTSFWGHMRRGSELGTQISGHWHVTNTSLRKLVLLKVRLVGYDAATSHVVTEGPDGVYGSRIIRPRQITAIAVNLSYFPPIIVGQKSLVADVIFTDNYEDEHRVSSAKFKPIRP